MEFSAGVTGSRGPDEADQTTPLGRCRGAAQQLTPSLRRTYLALVETAERHNAWGLRNISISIRQLAEAANHSRTTVHDHLHRLKANGFIRHRRSNAQHVAHRYDLVDPGEVARVTEPVGLPPITHEVFGSGGLPASSHAVLAGFSMTVARSRRAAFDAMRATGVGPALSTFNKHVRRLADLGILEPVDDGFVLCATDWEALAVELGASERRGARELRHDIEQELFTQFRLASHHHRDLGRPGPVPFKAVGWDRAVDVVDGSLHAVDDALASMGAREAQADGAGQRRCVLSPSPEPAPPPMDLRLRPQRRLVRSGGGTFHRARSIRKPYATKQESTAA